MLSSPVFWRDARMPFVELRSIADGRNVCYAPHSHSQWSLGAITEGSSTFCYRGEQRKVEAGSLVLINPKWVHACNPIDNQPWSYMMLYVDTDWLTDLRYNAGLLDASNWQDIAIDSLSDPTWYAAFCCMADCLLDADRELLEKQMSVVEFLTALMVEVAESVVKLPPKTPEKIQALAIYLEQNATQEVSLERLCEYSGYSSGYLIRAFKQYFGLTPHAYLLNYRVQCGQQALKQGLSIAEAAFNNGFADQPHFQRTFKKLLAATPNQYRQS